MLLVLAAPSVGTAAAPLPVGESDGVRVKRERGAIVVVFTNRAARLYRRVAGKRISIYCTELEAASGPGFTETASGGSTFRAPKRRRTIRTGDLTPNQDYCRVWLAARTVKRRGKRQRYPRKLIVSIPITQAGAVHLDEQSKSTKLLSVLLFASIQADNSHGYPTPAQLLANLRKRSRSPVSKIVALARPTDTPQAGSVGYYSDGRKHVAVVIVSASGRRLFVEWEADVLHTNVSQYLYDSLD